MQLKPEPNLLFRWFFFFVALQLIRVCIFRFSLAFVMAPFFDIAFFNAIGGCGLLFGLA